jgi:hypothetical protein
MRARIAAGLIGAGCEQIFGYRADLPSGAPGLEGLMKKIFAILGIKGSERAALRGWLKQREATAAAKLVSGLRTSG